MAANDLTTLANVKQYLGITASASDALLQQLISAASAFIGNYTSRNFLTQTYTEMMNGTGSSRLMVKHTPLISVSSVIINGLPVAAGGSSQIPGFWSDSKFIYLNGYRFTVGFSNVALVYSAGYDIAPLDVEQIAIELTVNKYKRKDRIGENSKNLAGQVISYSIVDLSAENQKLLGKYKRVSLV